MKILVVDNYDSFVFNLVHILYNIGVEDIEVYKNDKIDLTTIHQFDKILLSPGPGIPAAAGLMPDIIKQFASSKSILGICLGHQAIAENFGGKLINMQIPLHGISSSLTITKQDYLFDGLSSGIKIGHYHSWVVENELPNALEVLALDEQGNVMALRHREYDLRGLQFHPESVLTEMGIKMIENWVKGK
ncbi:anthranilate synthase component II [Flavobacterium cerinum]|uniref:Aminodeoxychorismate/anthranilate synthase component II n=1 Tax=Flavobacterium cerinum TaxID=2502784 RepID=A0A444GLU1_9FLAO|nr:aminodeoxychorismate/anthranilate synthase component II [Flavobacterium cerinum]RWW91897.1 aminodeoxychorismate/anthranilate synthase component II [Flavobacterium cerinum]